MAEPLKAQFGAEIPHKIAGMIAPVYPAFDPAAFIRAALDGHQSLDLLARGRHFATALQRHLPADYRSAVDILLASLGPKLDAPDTREIAGMAPFLYLPHVCFVARFGLDDFETSMQAQYELTQRFTAEFSLRAYLERYPVATLDRLRRWVHDPSPHVRRLVSEGTRPRLPWAPRLKEFQRDPAPVLALLDLLKDDPELYVRRSVANNLNDIGKDHPELLAETAKRWLVDATPERRWLVSRALRSAVKRGEAGALAVLGFAEPAKVVIGAVDIAPRRANIGGAVRIAFELKNAGARQQRVLVDFRIQFVKANGRTSPKVFKLKTLDLAPQESVRLAKTVSLAELTTRKHYPGTHRVELLLNGEVAPLGEFELQRG